MARRARRSVAATVWAGTAACSTGSPSVLAPSGPAGRTVNGLWWLMLWISLAVFLIVVGFLAVALMRRRRGDAVETEPRWGEPFVVIAGVVVPALILAAVFVVSLRDLNAITDDGGGTALTIQVIGHTWWWEARYPNGAVTANEIHMPASEPVRFDVTSADVIHSFWVPQLGPKIDMIPGRENETVLEAEAPGRYRGQCAEFCGLQHAHMALFVVADPPSLFDTWMRDQALPAASPVGEAARGAQVFLDSSCAGCHTIRGTPAAGQLGPDLTHVASRDTIAAGTLPNDPQDLEAWIADPQSSKPGAVMPPNQLSPDDLRALVAYLEGLR